MHTLLTILWPFLCPYAQNPLHTFPRNFPVFPVDGEVANLLATCWKQVAVMEFGKRHGTTDTTDFLPAPTCYALATGKLVWWILTFAKFRLKLSSSGKIFRKIEVYFMTRSIGYIIPAIMVANIVMLHLLSIIQLRLVLSLWMVVINNVRWRVSWPMTMEIVETL